MPRKKAEVKEKSTEEPSEYEKQRLENIKKNNEKMKSLGLKSETPKAGVKRKKIKEPKEEVEPKRKSARTASQAPKSQKIPESKKKRAGTTKKATSIVTEDMMKIDDFVSDDDIDEDKWFDQSDDDVPKDWVDPDEEEEINRADKKNKQNNKDKNNRYTDSEYASRLRSAFTKLNNFKAKSEESGDEDPDSGNENSPIKRKVASPAVSSTPLSSKLPKSSVKTPKVSATPLSSSSVDKKTPLLSSTKRKSVPSPVPPFSQHTEYKIFFVGFSFETIRSKYTTMVENLGGEVVNEESEATHLIASNMRPTVKFLCAINSCDFILPIDWLLESDKHSNFLEESNFSLYDPDAETKYNFSLKNTMETIQNAEKKVLSGYCFFVGDHDKMSQEEVKMIIRSAKGRILSRIPKPKDFTKGVLTKDNWFAITKRDTSNEKALLEVTNEDHIQPLTFLYNVILQNIDPNVLLKERKEM